MKENRTWSIYVLKDPLTKEVRYVGWAFKVSSRIADHIYKAQFEVTHKANWLNQLRSDGLRPICEIIESNTGDWAFAERKWIQFYKNAGARLTNATSGGEGIVGYKFSQETKARMRAAKVGKKLSADHIEKAHMPLRGRKRPAYVIEKMIAARRGFRHTEETKRVLKDKCTGWKHTEEARAKISKAGRRTCSEETKARIRAKHVGKKLSDEHRKKLSEAKQRARLARLGSAETSN